jgi:hypothetical protein
MSAAQLESAFFGCRDGQWWHLKQAVRYAEKATDVPGRYRAEVAYLYLGNAYEDEALYLGEFHKYDDAIESFETALRIAQRNERPTATALFSRGRARFRKVQSGTSDRAEQELALALEDLQTARTQTSIPAEQAEIPMWISAVYQYRADQMAKTDAPGVAEEYAQAEEIGSEGIATAWANQDIYWPRYQMQLAKLAWARDDKKESQRRADRVLEVAQNEDQGMRVDPQFVFNATEVFFASAAQDWNDIIDVVNRYLPYLPEDDPGGPRYRIELLLRRAETIAYRTHRGQRPPQEIRQAAYRDAATTLELADRVDCEFDRADFQYRAKALVASLKTVQYMEEYNGKVTAQNRAAAQALLLEIIRNFAEGFQQLDHRPVKAREYFAAKVGQQQLSQQLQQERTSYEQRWQDQDIRRTVNARKLLARFTDVAVAFELPPQQAQKLAQNALDVLAKVQPRHVPNNNAGRTTLQQVDDLKKRLTALLEQ